MPSITDDGHNCSVYRLTNARNIVAYPCRHSHREDRHHVRANRVTCTLTLPRRAAPATSAKKRYSGICSCRSSRVYDHRDGNIRSKKEAILDKDDVVRLKRIDARIPFGSAPRERRSPRAGVAGVQPRCAVGHNDGLLGRHHRLSQRRR